MELDINLLIATGVAAIAGIAVGLCIAILRGHKAREALRQQLGAENEQLKSMLAEARGDITAVSMARDHADEKLQARIAEVQSLQSDLAELTAQFNSLQNDHTRLHTEHRERQNQHAEQVQLLNETRENLKKEFENLAHRIFEDKGKSFTATSRDSLEALLKPFREQISGFQTRINEVHSESVKGNTALEKELQKVLEVGLEMNTQASNLSVALKGDKKTTGNWGEAQLERTLQLAGLQAGDHYESQASFKDEEGRRKLPDFLIKLPDDKSLVIDSKVSLVDYDRAIAADTDEERSEALNAHAQAVRNHIDDLASKDYANLPGIGSPDFVLMFMPVEPAYIEAMKHNKDLFNYGYTKGVVMVSHTTLMPILRTVANLWMIEKSNKEAREISSRAGEIYNQVCLVAGQTGAARESGALPTAVHQGEQGDDGTGANPRRHRKRPYRLHHQPGAARFRARPIGGNQTDQARLAPGDLPQSSHGGCSPR
jgi:DNA recombination protein RmuC